MRKAASSDGEYLPCSMAAMVCRVMPMRSANSAWVISLCSKRSLRMLLAIGGDLLMPPATQAKIDDLADGADHLRQNHRDYRYVSHGVDSKPRSVIVVRAEMQGK